MKSILAKDNKCKKNKKNNNNKVKTGKEPLLPNLNARMLEAVTVQVIK